MIRVALIAVLILGAFFKIQTTSAQTFEGMDAENTSFEPWVEVEFHQYCGRYHFGFSEDESILTMLKSDSITIAQIQSYNWSDEHEGWVPTYRNLTNVRVENGRFYSDETKGWFASMTSPGDSSNGLVIEKPWSWTEKDEYGSCLDKKLEVEGAYEECSLWLLPENHLRFAPKSELKIMRNEIYARYGYKFKPGGEMDTHFRATSWYMPIYDDVSSFLTDIEKANIALLLRLEKGQ